MTESLPPDEADTAKTAPEHLATVRHTPPPRIGEVVVSVHRQDDVVVLTVAGDLDMATAPQMGDAAKRALGSRPRALVLDLRQVEFMSSAGLSTLVATHQKAGQHSQVRIVATTRPTLRPLQLTGLDRQLAVFDDFENAVAPSVEHSGQHRLGEPDGQAGV